MTEQLKKQRQPVRGSFTRTVNELNELLASDDKDQFDIQLKYNKVARIYERLVAINGALLQSLLESNVSQEEYTQEEEANEKYDDDWTEVCLKFELQKPKSRKSSSSSVEMASAGSRVSTKVNTHFKLPKIELKKFGGEVTDWLGFWAQFEKIHHDDKLHASDKFQYLVQSMVEGTRAMDVVKAYPQTGANYPKVVLALQDRFGKPKMLKRVYVRELLGLVIRNSNTKLKVSDIYDKLESYLRSLESLGITADQMDVILFPLVESCLPEEILTAWQRSQNYGRNGSTNTPPKTEFDFLMQFIREEVDGEQQRKLAQTSFMDSVGNVAKREQSKKFRNVKKGESDIATAAGLFSAQGPSCIFCDKSHRSQECGKAQNMTLGSKEDKIKEKRACFACLKLGHGTKKCKSFVKCPVCAKKHYALMCPEIIANQKSKQSPGEVGGSGSNTVATNLNCSNTVLLKTISVLAVGNKRNLVVRLLFDEGSQRSYIREVTAQKLGLTPTGEELMKKSLFGGSTSQVRRHNNYQLTLQSLDGKRSIQIPVIDEPKLCGTIPRIQKGPWIEELLLKGIRLTDVVESADPDIEVLIGSDTWGGNDATQRFPSKVWISSGGNYFWVDSQRPTTKRRKSCNDHLWNLETLGIREAIGFRTKDDNATMVKEHFANTVTRSQEGRYSVCLPWANGKQKIPNNRLVAEKRLLNTTKKLQVLRKFDAYHEVFKSWEKEGIISTVGNDESNGHFLPHRPVFKPGSLSTPVRPVFDASCKTGRSPSLNDCLEKGPNLLELIPSLILRFREGKFGVISDIRKAFQMIEVNQEDRKYQKFLWWEDCLCKTIKVFQHNRVVFGINSSPFLLQAVLELHLQQFQNTESALVHKFLPSLYVDNCVTSVNTIEEYEEFKAKSTAVLAEAMMELRQWERTADIFEIGQPNGDWCGLEMGGAVYEGPPSNHFNIDSVSSVLGYKWNKSEDVIYLDLNLEEFPGNPTKRQVLSIIQKVFDPIGFTTPATLQPKLMLQHMWVTKLGWDEEISEKMKKTFHTYTELPDLLRIRIPRQIFTYKEANGIQFHTFGDASIRAYATCVFVRNVKDGEVTIHLAQAKARVSPLKKGTIPRLELLACLIGSRLTNSVKDALKMKAVPTYHWSDSSTALSWIRRNDEWGTFVGNRVKEILTLTKAEEWRFVPGILNPADLPSRGCNPTALMKSSWWAGPSWLRNPPSAWPSTEETVDEDKVTAEKKRTVATALTISKVKFTLPVFSSFRKNVRVRGWIRRFLTNSRCEKQERNLEKYLNRTELSAAELDILRTIQTESFPKGTTTLFGVPVIRGDDGLLRVKTKLINKNDTASFRWPVLLPKDHPLVQQIIFTVHRENGHIGTQCLLGKLRENFWILQSRRTIKRVLRQCSTCRRYEAKPIGVDPSSLPEKRVNISSAFETTGVDLAGPLFLRNGEKRWIVLYTCAVYRCVHLDLVPSLSTEAFLRSLARFIASFGRPITVYSDNGTNFVGAVNLFKKLDWTKIKEESEIQRIQWVFNPPTAAWWGGWWERLVRSIKDLLKRMLGRAKLDEEALRTSLATVAAAINARPLTTVTEDADDLLPLTPSMFLRGPVNSRSEITEMKSRDFQEDFRKANVLQAELRTRFRKEYLAHLVQQGSGKKTVTSKPGDIVLVGADNRKRLEWPMGRITELIPGKDGIIRVAKVKTKAGVLLRPLQRLYPLEVTGNIVLIPLKKGLVKIPDTPVADTKLDQVPVLTSRSGRLINKPTRYL